MATPQSFKSATTRLTLTYLAIIMALTIGFSVIFWFQSISVASIGLSSQVNQLRDNLYFTTPDALQRIRDKELRAFRENLRAKLLLVNAGMLVVGTAASYLLARRSLRPLGETLQTQSRFTSDAAHEFRTPLTAMKAEIDVALRTRRLTTKEAQQVLRSNREEITKLETLTAALLRLARGSEVVDRSYWQDYNLRDILKAAYGRLEDKALARNIKVILPRSRQIVHGDPDQLVELFVTLLGNAIKYSHENSKVRIAVEATEAKVKVSVIDNGIGITDVDLPHIFERFYRADPSRNKTKADGYGLGLSLADAIVKAHGGKIYVKTEYKKGSTFTVELPASSQA